MSSMNENIASAPLNGSEIDLIAAAIRDLTGANTDAVVDALLPVLAEVVTARCAADRAVVLEEVARFREKATALMNRTVAQTQRRLDQRLDQRL